MKLTQEQYDREINMLKDNGLIINNECISNYHLSNKHCSRYLTLLKWMRGNKIKILCPLLEQLYKTDVVIRRELSEILKPIEIQISSWVKYYFQFNDIGLDQINDGSIFENIEDFSIYTNKQKSKSFIQGKIKNVSKNNSTDDIFQIIDELSFGELIGLISLLNINHIKEIFPDREFKMDKMQLIRILNEMVFLRNWIAHNNILFTTRETKLYQEVLTLRDIVASLDKITLGNYSKKLQENIIRYKERSLNRYEVKNKSSKEEFLLM
ncbi:Abi family protein, partial [Mycoplasma marinum]